MAPVWTVWSVPILVYFLAIQLQMTEGRRRIAGGTAAYPGEFPYHAAFIIQDALGDEDADAEGWREHICGGVIIGKRKVLTLASCVNRGESYWKSGKVKVRAGVHRTKDIVGGQKNVGQTVAVDSFTKHNCFQHDDDSKFISFANDIAIINLEKDLNFNTEVQPIDIPDSTEDIYGNDLKHLTAIGFGSKGNSKHDIPGFPTDPAMIAKELQKVQVPIISHASCEHTYKYYQNYHGHSVHGPKYKNEFCASDNRGAKHKGICSGDEGGDVSRYICWIETGERWPDCKKGKDCPGKITHPPPPPPTTTPAPFTGEPTTLDPIEYEDTDSPGNTTDDEMDKTTEDYEEFEETTEGSIGTKNDPFLFFSLFSSLAITSLIKLY